MGCAVAVGERESETDRQTDKEIDRQTEKIGALEYNEDTGKRTAKTDSSPGRTPHDHLLLLVSILIVNWPAYCW